MRLFQAGDWAAATASLSAAVRRDDHDARAHYYLGRLELLRGDAEAAAGHLARATSLDSTSAAYQLWFGKALAQQGMRASLLRRPMFARRVIGAYERAVALEPTSLDARDGLVDFYAMAPAVLGGGGTKARAQAEAIARLDAVRGHLARGRLAAHEKDGPAIEREIRAAMAATPDSLRAYADLANWYAGEHAWSQAFAVLDVYLSRRPSDPAGGYAVARLAAASGEQLVRGERGVRAFLTAPPADAGPAVLGRASFLLGRLLALERQWPQARTALEQALAFDPRNDDAKAALRALPRDAGR